MNDYYLIFPLSLYYVGPMTEAEAKHYYENYTKQGYCVRLVKEVARNDLEVGVPHI